MYRPGIYSPYIMNIVTLTENIQTANGHSYLRNIHSGICTCSPHYH